MWSEQYENLNAYEKGEFRRLGNYLLSHTYMVRFTYDPSEETTLPNADYNMVMRLFDIFRDYFEVTGWKLTKDDTYGVVALISEYKHNRFRLKSNQKERLDAQSALAHFNIIQKMTSFPWSGDGNDILILPSILTIISNQSINAMKAELDEMKLTEDNRDETAEKTAAD